MITKAPRGTYDAISGLIERYQHIELVFRNVAETFGYKEIRTPVFEHTELFERGVGDTTDIVQKEMYTFNDRGGRSITLRPEGTSPVVRAFVEKKLYGQALPARFYYSAIPIFRYERPQAGRLRQHHQFGVELFGANDPRTDVEVIDLLDTFYRKLGLSQLALQINSVGCPKCRPEHREALLKYLADCQSELCATCQDRIERNPMRILDCKNERCRQLTAGAPVTIEHLCADCDEHYQAVKRNLELLAIPYTENTRLVRGLDYYTNTAFEFCSTALQGSGNIIGGGGRYNGLIEEIGGPSLPGIGFGAGLERIDLACQAEGVVLPAKGYCRVYLVRAVDTAADLCFQLLHDLRQAGVAADMDYSQRSLKSQMKQAAKLKADFALIIGEEELSQQTVSLKNMVTGQQTTILRSAALQTIKELL